MIFKVLSVPEKHCSGMVFDAKREDVETKEKFRLYIPIDKTSTEVLHINSKIEFDESSIIHDCKGKAITRFKISSYELKETKKPEERENSAAEDYLDYLHDQW